MKILLSPLLFLSSLLTWSGSANCQMADSNRIVPHESTSPLRHSAVPFSLIGYGLLAQAVDPLDELDRSIQKTFSRSVRTTRMDDYLQHLPALSFYGLQAAGVKGRHNLAQGTVIYLLSTCLVTLTTQSGKRLFHRLRPDGSANNSFPSGHTATAFSGAELLHLEYKDVSRWYGVGAYTVAATTGYLRVYNNKHWFSDVVTGAGIGILSSRVAAWLGPRLFKKLFRSGNNGR